MSESVATSAAFKLEVRFFKGSNFRGSNSEVRLVLFEHFCFQRLHFNGNLNVFAYLGNAGAQVDLPRKAS